LSRLPLDTSLPFFAYGTLKSSELAFKQIKTYVEGQQPANLDDFELAVIDGLPRAFESKGEFVSGELLTLDPRAYETIADFEQTPEIYKWTTGQTNRGLVNLVVYADDQIRTRHDKVTSWQASDDTLLAEGLAWALRELVEAKRFSKRNTVFASKTGQEAKIRFVELQATYSILWTIFERLTLFSEGPLMKSKDMLPRIQELQKIESWREAVRKAAIDTRLTVRSSSNPHHQVTRRSSFGFEEWYRLRNNVIHRGKTADREFGLLLRAAIDLFRTLAFFIHDQSPSLRVFMEKNLTSVEKDLIFIGFTQSELGRWEEENATRNNGLPNT
jgi:gamma-glutamylcyclotransferase (GGCT)/AIG2-like uncharacterized protein YtfP